MKRVLYLLLLLAVAFGCNRNAASKHPVAKFVVPTPPSILAEPQEKADYLAMHYWDNYDFADTALLHNEEITEQALVNYLNLLAYATPQKANQGVVSMLDKAQGGDSLSLPFFCDLYDRYLADPNSPMRNEDLFICFLQYVIASPVIDELEKIAPRVKLDLALKNRRGNLATDFTYTTRSGAKGRLYEVKAPYSMLFFNTPDCQDCMRVKGILTSSPLFVEMQKSGKLKIVAIYADEDLDLWRKAEYPAGWVNGYNRELNPNAIYDLKASPTLYLLDKDKRVLQKDCTIEAVEQYLSTLQ